VPREWVARAVRLLTGPSLIPALEARAVAPEAVLRPGHVTVAPVAKGRGAWVEGQVAADIGPTLL